MSELTTRRVVQRRPRAERMAEILAAAGEVFAEKGYDRAVVSDIAERAGLSEGAIFKFFDSKRGLVSAVIEAWYSRLIADIERTLRAVPAPPGKLRYLIHRHLMAVKDDPGLCRLVFRELRAGESYHGSELHALNRTYTAFVVDAVREGQEQGLFRPDLSPALARDMIFGGLEHHVWDFLGGRRELDLADASDRVSAFALAALTSPAADAGEGELARTVERLERIAARLGQVEPDGR
jgi:AcrR family transcriptional regulator